LRHAYAGGGEFGQASTRRVVAASFLAPIARFFHRASLAAVYLASFGVVNRLMETALVFLCKFLRNELLRTGL
jgi:hypothetical protein